MTMLFVVAGLTVLISSMCSLFEATLYSTRIGSLEAERAEGKHVRLGERFIAMKANIARPDLGDPDTQHDCEHGRSNHLRDVRRADAGLRSGSRRSPSA